MDFSMTPSRFPQSQMMSPNTSRANYTFNRTAKNGNQESPSNQTQANSFGTTISARTHFLTGTAERVITWHRIFKQRCYFEVIAAMISSRESPDESHDIILLKDKKGPILQVIHYVHHEMLENEFIIGQMLRCVGYMTGVNTMIAVSIRRATSEEIGTLQRFCYIGDFTISGLINAEENRSSV